MAKKIPKTKLRGLFRPAKSKRIAEAISIKSPTAFKKSIRELKKGRYTKIEKKSLVLARTRAKLQLRRKNLSPKERTQFKKISKTKIPMVKK